MAGNLRQRASEKEKNEREKILTFRLNSVDTMPNYSDLPGFENLAGLVSGTIFPFHPARFSGKLPQNFNALGVLNGV